MLESLPSRALPGEGIGYRLLRSGKLLLDRIGMNRGDRLWGELFPACQLRPFSDLVGRSRSNVNSTPNTFHPSFSWMSLESQSLAEALITSDEQFTFPANVGRYPTYAPLPSAPLNLFYTLPLASTTTRTRS